MSSYSTKNTSTRTTQSMTINNLLRRIRQSEVVIKVHAVKAVSRLSLKEDLNFSHINDKHDSNFFGQKLKPFFLV